MGILNTTPRTWVASEVVTAAEMNAEIHDPFTAMQSAWTAYTTTPGGLTTTSGTLVSTYNQVGKTVDFFIQFTLGASSAVTGSITFTLPVTALQTQWDARSTGAHVGGGTWPLSGLAISTTAVTIRAFPATAGAAFLATSATVPFTWATGDILTISGRYEAA